MGTRVYSVLCPRNTKDVEIDTNRQLGRTPILLGLWAQGRARSVERTLESMGPGRLRRGLCAGPGLSTGNVALPYTGSESQRPTAHGVQGLNPVPGVRPAEWPGTRVGLRNGKGAHLQEWIA